MVVKIKKPNGTKMCVVKRRLKSEDYKHCLEAAKLENKINYLDTNNLNMDNLQENHKKLLKNGELTLKIQQRFQSEKHNVFTEKVYL